MLRRGDPRLPCRSGGCWPSRRERRFPTFQGFLQGLHEASPAVAVTVTLAGVLTPWEGQGCQVKVHQGQVMTSHLGNRKQIIRDRRRCSSCLYPLPPPHE